jgi:hypothetical protein
LDGFEFEQAIREAREVENLGARVGAANLLREVGAEHDRHEDVNHKHVEWTAVGLDQPQGLRGTRGGVRIVTGGRERSVRKDANGSSSSTMSTDGRLMPAVSVGRDALHSSSGQTRQPSCCC